MMSTSGNRDLKNLDSSDSDYSEDTDANNDDSVLDAVYSEIPDLELPDITSEVPEDPIDDPDHSESGKPNKNENYSRKAIDINWDDYFPGEDPDKIESYKDSKEIKIPPIQQSARDLVNKYLATPENLGIHKRSRYIRNLPREPVDFNLLFDKDSFSPVDTELKAVRDVVTGEIIDYVEVDLPSDDEGETLSMNRPPLPPNTFIRGSTDQYPFMPGGFEEDLENTLKKTEGYTETANIDLNFKDDEPGRYLGEELSLSIPGLDGEIFYTKNKSHEKVAEKDFSSLNFGYQTDEILMRQYHSKVQNEMTEGTVEENVEIDNAKVDTEDLTVNKAKLEVMNPNEAPIEEINSLENNYKDIRLDDTYSDDLFDIKDFWKMDEVTEDIPKSVDSDKNNFLGRAIEEDATTKMPPERPVLMISNVPIQKGATSTEWAEIIDVTLPVPEFDNLKEKAHTYPFELDNFQKQAILKLELGHHVFVAAHTSAGKTVVAEYAIAMARKNYTRTIYTSPIKALSNQKYNDFNRIFGDVGLLTGDLQLNPKAACLVMTTEILRSMLYCGSDVTRDLEFVIFDEVHYINNSERGYVWEEALILLPAHVKIIMLSATVPNTLQFADWVGRTKRRKVYVVSTLKRPVPLCHYLYTGSGGKSKDERFLFLDQNGQFLLRGYNEAVAAKKSRASDHKKNFGPKGGKQFLSPKAEQTIWIGFIDHLKRNDKLPVVAFTLSRHRCDLNAENLMSVDLTTAKEKSYIRSFFQRCLQKLIEPDRHLPQVINLQRVLENGIGVHHSGILPLLKEIVEMLFQSGHVKILFATETFAMGVNMPTRTVVFDSVTKFDGQEMRPLLPAEYIQMAGRAGRRGLDDTGTVIILCKEDVPDIVTLKSMSMCVPQRLASQFRLTYSMILSLLRAPTVTVEGMMKRSFREFNQMLQADKYKKQLEMAEKDYSEKCETPLAPHLAALVEFYDVAYEYIGVLYEMMPILLNQFKVTKEMVAGKVLIVSAGPYVNQLAVYLNSSGPTQTPLKVLVLDTPIKDDTKYNFDLDEDWYRMLGLSVHHETVGTEEATLNHTILCIAPKNVVAVTKTTFKIEADSIISDWERRQIPRMKDLPVEAKCAKTVRQLSQLSHATYLSATQLERINLLQNLNVSSGEILANVEKINSLSSKLEKLKKCTDIANFKSEFAIVYERKLVQLKRDKFRYLLSSESLALYPEYQRRLMVLKELNYIDDKHGVIMKGRVACSMGTNELILSELIFRNVFTDKTPAEIAALLSCFVFQAKTMREPELTDRLKEGLNAILKIDHELTSLETKYMISNTEGLPNNINSGLIGVVYEWAEGRPFASIMSLIDVQEGIIVRCIQQLNEVLVDMKNAAEQVGDTTLRLKMMQASLAIKRDIVFAASLYTSPKE